MPAVYRVMRFRYGHGYFSTNPYKRHTTRRAGPWLVRYYSKKLNKYDIRLDIDVIIYYRTYISFFFFAIFVAHGSVSS